MIFVGTAASTGVGNIFGIVVAPDLRHDDVTRVGEHPVVVFREEFLCPSPSDVRRARVCVCVRAHTRVCVCVCLYVTTHRRCMIVVTGAVYGWQGAMYGGRERRRGGRAPRLTGRRERTNDRAAAAATHSTPAPPTTHHRARQ